jgi:hypothetical protein
MIDTIVETVKNQAESRQTGCLSMADERRLVAELERLRAERNLAVAACERIGQSLVEQSNEIRLLRGAQENLHRITSQYLDAVSSNHQNQPPAQTIESAPRDHTPILVFWRGCGWRVSWYDWDDDREGFKCEADQCVPKNQYACTHWMPLPSNPV